VSINLRSNDKRKNGQRPESRLCLSTAAANLHFPSVSVCVALWLLPGVAWGVTQILSKSDQGAADYSISALGIAVVVGLFMTLEFVVMRRLVLDKHFGLRFFSFRTRFPFSPPVPKFVARLCCSREGSWGPGDLRASFGSPMATSCLPQHVRWAWTIGPVVSTIVVVTNTLRAGDTSTRCDALQVFQAALLATAAAVFLVLLPHGSVLQSLLCALGHILNCIVVLLGIMCRHELIDRDGVIAAALLGAYVSSLGSVILYFFRRMESRILAREALRLAIPDDLNLQEPRVTPQCRSDASKEVKLRALIELICIHKAGGSGGSSQFHRLLFSKHRTPDAPGGC
jgi:hypothetical protein